MGVAALSLFVPARSGILHTEVETAVPLGKDALAQLISLRFVGSQPKTETVNATSQLR